jgi:hypothetical protein
LISLVFAPSTGSDVRSRIAVRHPFLALISGNAHGLIATVDLRGMLRIEEKIKRQLFWSERPPAWRTTMRRRPVAASPANNRAR